MLVWVLVLISTTGTTTLPFKYPTQMDCETAGREIQTTLSNPQDPLRPGPRVSFFCFKGPA